MKSYGTQGYLTEEVETKVSLIHFTRSASVMVFRLHVQIEVVVDSTTTHTYESSNSPVDRHLLTKVFSFNVNCLIKGVQGFIGESTRNKLEVNSREL